LSRRSAFVSKLFSFFLKMAQKLIFLLEGFSFSMTFNRIPCSISAPLFFPNLTVISLIHIFTLKPNKSSSGGFLAVVTTTTLYSGKYSPAILVEGFWGFRGDGEMT